MQPLKMPSEPKEGEWKSETEAIWIPNHAYKMGGFWGASIDGSGGMVTAIGKTKEAAELLARKICDAVNSREKWLKDSSLSTHFPFTAERMNALEKENSELKEKVANLEETNTLLNRRVQAMESKHPERSHLWGSEETLKAEIVRLRKELANANRGAEMNYRVLQLSTKRVCKLHDELIAAQSDRDRFKKLAEKSKWVSVFERLPDEEGHYLVHGLNKRTWETYYDPSDCKPTWRNNFTHWMPLPQPPSTQP